MRRSLRPLVGAALLVVLSALSVAPVAATSPSSAPGTPHVFTIEDPRITESSGLAASHAHPGIYWTHNDSDDGPYLYAIDSRTGKTVATVTMSGVGKPRDVEAISMGPDDTLYVGDTGDNTGGGWSHVWIYRLPEPKELHDQTVRATQYTVTYADGPRDAEALMVHPKTGRVYIADKKEDGGHLFEGPATLSPTGTNVFRKVAPIDLWVTDGAFSPDGDQLVVRGYFGGILYDWRNGRPKRKATLTVPMQGQGESVTYTADGSALMYGSEGARSQVVPGQLPGAGSGGPSHGASGQSGGSAGGNVLSPDYTKIAVVLIVALAVLYGGTRVASRRARER
ncbi:WD40 repeat domain-containing protein [Streptomyces odontomachi]|uniref:WD40 repeat domain-containing protein n=1 Tax=Streptomyces odontomachi TaxID=2944940 RepID=UPI00210EA282|nr:WD40 repeat domain-containing protein [Streptomyces sp. ODS25]